MSFWKKENLIKPDDDLNNNLNNNLNDNLNNGSLDNEGNENNYQENFKSSNIDNQNVKESNNEIVRSALSKGTIIQGKLSFDTPVSIDGKLSGELFSSETVIIGKSGIVDAQINVRSLVVYGKVTGNIKATEKTLILNGAEINGTLQTASLSVEQGAVLNCKFKMESTKR